MGYRFSQIGNRLGVLRSVLLLRFLRRGSVSVSRNPRTVVLPLHLGTHVGRGLSVVLSLVGRVASLSSYAFR